MPMWNVILLGDEEYDEGYVCQTMLQVLSGGIEKEKAKSCFQEAQQHGSSIAIVVQQEHAEHYVQQFGRCDPIVFSTCEPETPES